VFIVHARKAWLSGLSPKENRDIPPLRYEVAHQLKQDFPVLQFVINGGVATLEETEHFLQRLDGVMIGREAYGNPWLLAEADRRIFGVAPRFETRREVLEAFLPLVERELAEGQRLGAMTRHILGLYQGVPGARAWRRHISENAHLPGADADVIRRAAALTREPLVSC
jgi:tRNA-dihydrouridine synthase A